MEITFKNLRAEKQFSSKYRKNWKYPKQVKTKLEETENYIINANSMQDIAAYPPFHLERLKGNRKDEWSIRLGNTGYRVTFSPCDDKGNLIDGDILAKCKTIRVIMVTEVSNHYE